MAKRIALIVLAFTVAAAVIFTGCAPARKPINTPGTQTNYNNTGTNYDNYTKVGDQLGVRDWTNNYRTDMYNDNLNNNMNNRLGNNVNLNTTTQRSEDIARACEQVQGVENATVVVTGNTAYVGIDMEANTRIANERDIKNEVAQKVRASGKDINTVYVSSEVDFMDRLRNVGNGLRNGRPVDAFTTELNEMVNRISPTRW
jgi:YhcN/YlaJ family sporulation lipoprotein